MTTKPRWAFEQVGLSYRLWSEEAGVEMMLGRLKRSGQELQGELRVMVKWEGIKTVDGSLHQARFNVSSATTRSTTAKILKGRADKTPFAEMDWGDALEHLCQYVLNAERAGEPLISMNGPMPTERKEKYAISRICPSEDVAWLYGPGGMGKSVVALALALSVAKGMEILPGLAPQVKGPVIYLDWETKPFTVRERIEHIAQGHDFKPTKDFYYRRCRRPLYEDAEEVSRIVAEKGIKFVVIDSCGPAQGGTGERGDANEATLRLFDAIRLIGTTTLVVDHVSKQEMRDRKGKVIGSLPYGSIYKVNLARAAWEVQNGTSPFDDNVHIRLINTKANDSRLYAPVDLSIVWDSDAGIIIFDEDTAFIPEEVAPQPEASSGAGQRNAVIDVLAGKVEGLTTKEISDATGIGQQRVNNIILADTKAGKNTFEAVPGIDPRRIRLTKRGGLG